MRSVSLKFCCIFSLLVGGCAADESSFQGPRADMTEKYPRKPFFVKRQHSVVARAGNFVMPPGLPPLPPSASSIQRPIKGSGENGPPPAYPSLTDTEATYGR